MKIFYKNEKLQTHIKGLDKILFGGIQLQDVCYEGPTVPLKITICGERGSSKSLLGMQLLHGLTKSLRALNNPNGDWKLVAPIYITNSKYKNNLSDLLLDTLISQYTNRIIEEHIEDNTQWSNSEFCRAIFNFDDNELRAGFDPKTLDRYVAEGELVYSNRTNSLHLLSSDDSRDSLKNQIAIRKHHVIEKYKDLKAPFSTDFFPIEIYGKEFREPFTVKKLEDYEKIPCLLFDSHLQDTIMYEDASNVLILIRIIRDESMLDQINSDLIIRLRTFEHPANGYLMRQLSILKSVLQNTAQGWHQYKRVDYGFEVYPSTHLVLQRRRHMNKELLRSNLSMFSETFAQFQEHKNNKNGDDFARFKEYETKKVEYEQKRWEEHKEAGKHNECVSDILEDILTGPRTEPLVTAFIGERNTYKRYLTLGSTFNAACRGEHTLKILLEKDSSIMRRRVECPVMRYLHRDEIEQCETRNCKSCYDRIHFKEIRMGCISPAELIYYIQKQIELSRKDKSNEITRIIIDDLMKIDFCFPILKEDNQFLTTLTSVCKEEGVDLLILCDRNASLVHELRAQSDNVICTEYKDDTFNLYIEKYAGYKNPSHIFACQITEIGKLFYCGSNNNKNLLQLNNKYIKGLNVCSMRDYWVTCDTDKIIKYLRR